MNRRSFLQGLAGIFAAGCAPAVFSSGIASGILMPVREIALPTTQPFPIKFAGLIIDVFGVDKNGCFVTNTLCSPYQWDSLPKHFTPIGYTRDGSIWRTDFSKLNPLRIQYEPPRLP